MRFNPKGIAASSPVGIIQERLNQIWPRLETRCHLKDMFFKLFLAALFGVYIGIIILLLVRRFFPKWSRKGTSRPPVEVENAAGRVFIELAQVDKSFDEQAVLKQTNLKIFQGETLGVLGKSGSGKSVLLKLIVGLLEPDEGRILFKGEDITMMEEPQLLEVRKRVSYVFQSGAFFDSLDVKENVAYPLRERGILDEEAIDRRVTELLADVELEGMGDQLFDELSAGSKKQVAIARAIANAPEAILYDEPTTGVDPIIGKSLNRLIRKLNKQNNLTSVVVTHDLRCIEMVADRIILIKDGLIHFEGGLDEFHASQAPYVRAFIAGSHYEEESLATA